MSSLRRYTIGILFSLAPILAFGQQQTVRIDWDTHTITSPPITVNGTTSVAVEIDNINDYLYTYNGLVIALGNQQPAFGPGFGAPAAPPAGPCTNGKVEENLSKI
jgi:hypothetical protein